MSNNSAQNIIDKIQKSKNILINLDTRTDYDTICCSRVLGSYIGRMNIKYDMVHAKNISEVFETFFKNTNVKTNTDISSVDLSKYDLIIFNDSSSKNRISLDKNFKISDDIETINIDHHTTNDHFGKMNYVKNLGSCCSVLYQMFQEAAVDLLVEELEILAIGIITDTNFFTSDTTTATDFKIAAELTEKGVRIWEMISKLRGAEYVDQIKLKRLVFNNMKVDLTKKIAYSTLTQEEISHTGIDMSKVFIRPSDLLKTIIGVNIAFTITEIDHDPKYFELSMRSNDPDTDLSKLAERFGGGGHKNAAGAKFYKYNSVSEVLEVILQTLAKSNFADHSIAPHE